MAEIKPTTTTLTAYIPNHAQPFALLRIAWGTGAGWAPELGIGPDYRTMAAHERALVDAAARNDKVEACTLAGVFVGQLQMLYQLEHGKRLKVTVAETPTGVVYVGQFEGKQLEVMVAPSNPPTPCGKRSGGLHYD